MKKELIAIFAALMAANGAFAQTYCYNTEFNFSPTGVSNEGVAVGGSGQDTPFILWNPFKGENGEAYVIGGMSSGMNGAAGPARISADGKTVIGSMWQEKVEVPTTWNLANYESFPYTFRFAKKGSDFSYFIVGVSEDGQTSRVLKSGNNGTSWKDGMDATLPNLEGAATCFSCMSSMKYFVGTDKGKLYTSTGNPDWQKEVEIAAPEGSAAVTCYLAMDFYRYDANDKAKTAYGAVAVALEDGTNQVWFTLDAGDTFAVAQGVEGTPTFITHAPGIEVFWLTTAEGGIYTSIDKGATWQQSYFAEGVPFSRISFTDAQRGAAIAGGLLLVTTDGGSVWRTAVVESEFSPFAADDKVWNDVVWGDNYLAVAGNRGRFYISDDNAQTFKQQNMTGGTGADNFTLVMFDRDVFNVFADDHNFYRRTFEPYVQGYGPGRYDVEAGTWTPMPSYGVVADSQVGSSWGISDDGQYTTGILRYVDQDTKSSQGGAAVWNPDGTMVKLGTIPELAGHVTRANRISNDGSVVVGFTDCLGPWLATVWTRQADGSYEAKVIMTNPDETIEDVNLEDFMDVIKHFAGNALALPRNGKWVGGTGGNWYGISNAWIWSEETGLIDLGVAGACVEVNDEGTFAVGRGEGGFGNWIWTKEGGARSISDYVKELGGEGAYCGGFYAMSPNGRFLVGPNLDGNGQPLGYMVDLMPEKPDHVEIMEADQVKAAVYPNPVVSELHVDLPYDSATVATTISLYDMQGGMCRSISDCHQSNVLNVEGLANGIYVLDVKSGNSHKVFKVIVK